MRVVKLLGFVLVLIVVSACSDKAQQTRQLFNRYIKASNAHDLETLRAMTDDEIVWKLGPYTLVGKDDALRPHAQDAALHTILEPRDIEIRGDTVECTLIERNDVLRAFDVDSLVHHARYVFRNGLMYRKSPLRRDDRDPRFLANLKKFRAWAGDVHPEALAKLDSLGSISAFSFELGKLRSDLLREWGEAGRP